MDITDELIGCYVEGACNSEELQAIREYLVKNPDEYERILGLMDNYRHIFLEPSSSRPPTSLTEKNYLDFSIASAAFVPFQSVSPTSPNKDSQTSTLKNLKRLLDEVEAT